MRSRFLNVDYFCRSPEDVKENLEFLSLPIPELLPSDPLPGVDFGNLDVDVEISTDPPNLFFENALSRFISAVIPQHHGDRPETPVYKEGEKEIRGAVDHTRIFQGILFELPEIELSRLENLILENPMNDCGFMSSPQISNSSFHEQQDVFENISGVERFYLVDLAGTQDSVDRVKPKHYEECSLEDSGYMQNEEPYINIIPLFEACDPGFALPGSHSVEETFHAIVDETIILLSAHSNFDSENCDLLNDFTVDNFLECDLYIRVVDAELRMEGLMLLKDLEIDTCLDLKMLDHCYLPMEQLISFHEVQLLQFSFMGTMLSYDDYVIPTDRDLLEHSVIECTPSRSFYEVFVSPDLALTDDVFKSLAVPAVDDSTEIESVSAIIKSIFCDLQLYNSSTSDQIYLDWHLSQEDECTHSTCCLFRRKLDVMTSFEIPSSFVHPKDDLIINGIISADNLPNSSRISCSQEKCETTQTQLFKTEGFEMPPYVENSIKNKSEKVSLLMESMSLTSDLNFFLNARKGTCQDEQNRAAEKATVLTPPSMYLNKSLNSPGVICPRSNVETHFIILLDVILNIIDAIHKSYMSVVQDEKKSVINRNAHDTDIARFSKRKLIDQIKILTEEDSACESETVMHLSALYAMKQMAHHVCFSGIHACYLYMSNLFEKLGYLGARFHSLKSAVEDAYNKAEKDTMEFHPALTVMENILQKSIQNGKILIVADRAIWWTLSRKLNAMGVSFQEFESVNACFDYNMMERHLLNRFSPVATLETRCLVISHESLSGSFPLHAFSNIVEYGGCYGSSKVSNISQEVNGIAQVQFLKLKLENHHFSSDLSDGFNVFQNLELSLIETYQSSSQLHELDNGELINLLNWVPHSKDCKLLNRESCDNVGASSANPPVLHSKDSNHVDSTDPSFPNLIVIVNTLTFSHELLTSRRSSYQNILAMEKDGIQVVEREMLLPVDLILGASTCLLWFDAKRFLQSATPEVPPSVSLCVENISTCLLLSVSFSFSQCILVRHFVLLGGLHQLKVDQSYSSEQIFEGETRFLSSVMEASDGIYAAGASLDIHLQLFFSGCSDLTDKIVHNCIAVASKSRERLLPVMLESETLVESFLTSFPSINPLSAHALLSSGARVSDFMHMTCEKRLQTIQKYHVPDESINLFSVLCRFGEIGECKSDMTECSSTVASALDSDSNYRRERTLPKKRKLDTDDHLFDIPSDEYLNFMPENILGSVVQPSKKLPSRPFKPFSHSEDPFIFRRNDAGDPELKLQAAPSALKQKDRVELYGTENCNDIKMDFDDLEFQSLFSSPDDGILSWDSHGIGKRSSSGIDSYSLRLSPSNQSVFVSGDCRMESHNWTSSLSSKYSLDRKMSNHNPDVKIGGFRKKIRDNILQESIMKQKHRRSAENITVHKAANLSAGNISFENTTNLCAEDMSSHKKTNLRQFHDSPYSRASDLQQGSPLTLEFLKRIKDKSRMCNKFPHHTPKNHSVKTPSSQKSLKRQSPSVLDSYRYQASGSKPKSTSNQKWSRIFKSSLDLLKEQKTSCRLSPSWTPPDKRSRQTLSFTRTGNEKQSKLAWSDQGDHNVKKRYREET